MNAELLYTSAPAGLKQGSRGFCTVVSTAGMPINLASKLESLSGYRHVYPSGTPNSSKNPVGFSHLRFSLGGRMVSVISRISDYGLDYSQRTNKLAHHIVVDAPMPPSGPAALLIQSDVMRDVWDGRCATVPPPALPTLEIPPRVCSEWESMTGDAGWGGIVANTWLRPQPKPLFIVFSEDQAPRLLSLIAESIALLPVRQRWQATFGTYVTNLPPDVDCKVRCVIAGSEEARMASARGTVINLTAPIGPAVDSDATRAAREGLSLGGGATIRAPISVADAETSESDPSPSAVPPAYEEFEFDVDKPFGEVARQAPPDVRYTGTRFKTQSTTVATTEPGLFSFRRILVAAICLLVAFLGLAGYGIYRNTKQLSQVVKEAKTDVKRTGQDSTNIDELKKDPTAQAPTVPAPQPQPIPVAAADFQLSLEVPSLPSTEASVIEVQVFAEALNAVAKIEPLKPLPAEWEQWEAKWKWQRKEPNLFWKDMDSGSTNQISITNKETITTEFRVIAIVSNSSSGQSLPPIESKIIRVAKVAPPPPPAYKPEDFDLDIRFILKGNQDGKAVDIPLQLGALGAEAQGSIKPKRDTITPNYQTTWKWFVKQENKQEELIQDASGEMMPIAKNIGPNSEIRCEVTIKFESGAEIVVKSQESSLKIADALIATIDLREVLKSPSIRDLSFPIEIPTAIEGIVKDERQGNRISAFGLKLQKDPTYRNSVVNPAFRNLKSFAEDTETKSLDELEEKLKAYQKKHKEILKKIDALKAVCENKGRDAPWAINIVQIIETDRDRSLEKRKIDLSNSVDRFRFFMDQYKSIFEAKKQNRKQADDAFIAEAMEKEWVSPSATPSDCQLFLKLMLAFLQFWEEPAPSLGNNNTPKKHYMDLIKDIEQHNEFVRDLLEISVSIDTKENAFAIHSKSKSSDALGGVVLSTKDKELADFGMRIILRFSDGESDKTDPASKKSDPDPGGLHPDRKADSSKPE